MVKLAFFVLISIVAAVIFIIKCIIGDLTGSEKLNSTTFKDETKKVMDTTAKGISWMEQQWEESKKNALEIREIAKDDRFIAYNNETVLDTRTNLMWAAKDNGENIKWKNAKTYCENFRGGSYTDWRMPTQEELAGLYDASQSRPARYSIDFATELIDITGSTFWASEVLGNEAACFYFEYGSCAWLHQSDGGFMRALPVRSIKRLL